MVDSETSEAETEFPSFVPQKKEPWLAVSASWILPGAGHFYLCMYWEAIAFFILWLVLQSFFYISVLLNSCPIIISFLLMFIYAFVLPILVCISAYRCAKRIGGGIANESRIPQKPWLAVFLSLLLPGLGHLYLRKWRFMAVFFAAYIAITLVSRGFVYVAIRVILVTFLCTHVFLMCHPNYKEWIQKFIVFVLFLVCVNFIAFILRPWLVGKYIIQLTPNSVGTSMEPTIKAHDRLIVDKLCYRLHSPRTGDIVAIRLPEGFGTFAALHAEPPFFLAKRVVAVPGETVIIRDNEVYVNGKKQCGQDTKSKENNDKGYLSEGSMLESYEVFGVVEPYTVPRGYYFVLGDNMSDSIDSRHIGPIPRSDIVGRVIKIYWPPSRAGSLYQNK